MFSRGTRSVQGCLDTTGVPVVLDPTIRPSDEIPFDTIGRQVMFSGHDRSAGREPSATKAGEEDSQT